MRTLVPAETLVYLETNDLAAALQPIVDSKPFGEVAKSKPDLSALKGVQLAVAITGFEIAEEKLTDEHSVGRVQPHFVAIADTHAWNYQAVSFAEKKLGAFVANVYDSEPTLEKNDKNGGKYFTWTAKDGRKAYALVIDSLIFFGNDETAIDKCLAVRRGLADSIVKTGKVPPADPATLASGYVSTDGIAQIANIVGLKFASEAGEDSEVQSAIAGILPQLLRNSITEISWTATKTEQGIEDKYLISMPPDMATDLDKSFVTDSASERQMLSKRIIEQIPTDPERVTRYNLKMPDEAWRSVLAVTLRNATPAGQRVILSFTEIAGLPYGIREPEAFLRSLGHKDDRTANVVIAQTGSDSDDVVLVSMSGDYKLTQSSFVKELKPKSYGEDGWSSWSTADGDVEAMFEGGLVTLGSPEELKKVRLTRTAKNSGLKDRLAQTDAPIATVARDKESLDRIVEMLSPGNRGSASLVLTYFTETRFTRTGIERRTVSDFGLIGSIIAQLGQD